MKIKDLKPGDVLLYTPKPNAGIIPKLIAIIQWIVGQGWGSYSHVSIVDEATCFELEATHPVSRRYPIGGKNGECFDKFEIKVFRPKCDDEKKLAAVQWCQERLGVLYDYIEILSFATVNIKTWYTCSDFVDLAYCEGANYPLLVCDKVVSPNEIAQSKNMDFIGILES